MRHRTNEDLNGYIRGGHVDGDDICDRFEFHMPGSSSTPEKVVWGWNDLDALYCERCKRLATEHIVLKEPKKMDTDKLKKDANGREIIPGVVSSFTPGGNKGGGNKAGGGGGDPTAANPNATEERRAREAEQAAYFNSGYDPSGMLDEMNDPLAINARPKPKPPPPPPAPVAPAAPPVVIRASADAATTAATGYKAPLSYDEIMALGPSEPAPNDPVQDPALAELLSRDASANEAFKREVERMVRDATRQEEISLRLAPNTPSATGAAPNAVAESKDLSGAAVPMGTFADAAALLESVKLPQYVGVFEEEEMDPNTLIEVLQQQGKASLEEALKELGIKSMGHRLKIINALIVQ